MLGNNQVELADTDQWIIICEFLRLSSDLRIKMVIIAALIVSVPLFIGGMAISKALVEHNEQQERIAYALEAIGREIYDHVRKEE